MYDRGMALDKILDPTDLQIIERLQANAREAQVDIARAVGLGLNPDEPRHLTRSVVLSD